MLNDENAFAWLPFLFFRLTLIDDEMVEPLISVWGLRHKFQ